MNSKERVTRALEFSTPDKLPVICGSAGVSDVCGVGLNISKPGHEVKFYYDYYGCGWSRSNVPNMGIVTDHPIKAWSDMDTHRWPDPNDGKYYTGMEQKLNEKQDQYVLTFIGHLLFERMYSLRGMENLLSDIYLEREWVEKLADKVVTITIGFIENIHSRFKGAIHGLRFTDDWGTESGLLISPDLWRSIFKPRYKLIFDTCKKVGWHTWMHCCGKTDEIMEDLIEIGLTTFNTYQPKVFDIETVSKKVAGKLCFDTYIDIQRTLPSGNEEQILQEAEYLLKNWGKPEGGFILREYPNAEAVGSNREKKLEVYEIFKNLDPWKKGNPHFWD